MTDDDTDATYQAPVNGGLSLFVVVFFFSYFVN